ncbi:retrovirus-related pol polyprotein from transposon TNT 1-94 [Tanacetum coccineum]
MCNDLILAHEVPSDTRDTKIVALRLRFNAFKSLEGEKVMGTFTRLKFLLNDLENNGVTIPQAEVNAMFVNSLPRKWLSVNQTQRVNNFIKNDSLATLYGKYNYEEGLIDQIYESVIQRFSIQASISKALISNTPFQESDSYVEEDKRTSNEFMADLNAEYHERALLANQKRFYKISRWVGSARKPIDKTKETCFSCGKTRHFQKDCPSNKTSTPSYPSSNNSFNKFKSYTPPINQTSSHNTGNYKKDYKEKYKGLKAKMVILTQRIDDLTKGKSEKGKSEKGKSEKGLIAESFNWDEESVSSEDEGTTRIRAFMAIAEDEPSVGKADARSAFRGKGKRKENNPSKEVLFTKADVSTSESALPLPPLPKLTGADPFGASKSLISLSDLTTNMADLTLNTASKEIKKSSNKASQNLCH